MMSRPFHDARRVLVIITAVTATVAVGAASTGGGTSRADYQDVIALFKEWRAFQRPKLVNGGPDYSAAAMAAQQRELPRYLARLAAIDPAGWPAAQQVDWHLVKAEMNGLDFDLRVRKPWATNPAFYVTVFPSQSDQPA